MVEHLGRQNVFACMFLDSALRYICLHKMTRVGGIKGYEYHVSLSYLIQYRNSRHAKYKDIFKQRMTEYNVKKVDVKLVCPKSSAGANIFILKRNTIKYRRI